jgi:hypothetical protein
MFEHGVMSKACERKRQELERYFDTKPQPGPELENARLLYRIADTFIRMQQDRHTADYDNSTRWTRVKTLVKIDSVESAFESWKAIRDDPSAQDFLVTLLLKKR